MSLISTEQKAAIDSVFDDIHDTFGRDILIYKTERGASIVTSANPLFGKILDASHQNPTLKPYTAKARISYANSKGSSKGQSQSDGSMTDAQLGIDWPMGTVRIKVDATAYGLLSQAQKVEIDGVLCEVISNPSRTGIFAANYYVVFLKRVE